MTISEMGESVANRGKILFSVLAGLLHERGRQVLKSVESQNGFEAYRLIQQDLLPAARTRALALLQAINQWPTFHNQQGLMLQLSKLEQAEKDYETASGTKLTDNHKMAVLMRCLTGQLRSYMNLLISDHSGIPGIEPRTVEPNRRNRTVCEPLFSQAEPNRTVQRKTTESLGLDPKFQLQGSLRQECNFSQNANNLLLHSHADQRASHLAGQGLKT